MDISKKAIFLSQLNVTPATLRNYRSALNSPFLREILQKEYSADDIFELTDIETLWLLYSKVNLHPKNITNHRLYSAVIMKYIRFLNNGKKYGRRIDFNRSKSKR